MLGDGSVIQITYTVWVEDGPVIRITYTISVEDGSVIRFSDMVCNKDITRYTSRHIQ